MLKKSISGVRQIILFFLELSFFFLLHFKHKLSCIFQKTKPNNLIDQIDFNNLTFSPSKKLFMLNFLYNRFFKIVLFIFLFIKNNYIYL